MSKTEARKRGRPRSFHEDTDSKIVQSLDKALTVLKVVASGSGLSLSEISEAADIPAPTVYRSLITMQQHGIVAFDDLPQLWRIGVTAFRIGSTFLTDTSIVERARPIMQELMQETGETANLGIISNAEVVFLSQVETHEPIRAFFRPGTRGAVHASGIGKAIYAFSNEAAAREIHNKLDFHQFTPKTIGNSDGLSMMRTTAHEAGYAVDDEERTLGMRCIAAPIFNAFGEPVAAISISGPSVRLPVEKVAGLGAIVRKAADAITSRSGGRQSGD